MPVQVTDEHFSRETLKEWAKEVLPDELDTKKILFVNFTPGIGTYFYDPEIMDGLVEYLKENPVDKVIMSGIFPNMGNVNTKEQKEAVRILDKPNFKGEGGVNDKYYNGTFKNIGDRDYVRHLEDVRRIAKREFKKLVPVLKGVEVVYLPSENDFRNINRKIKEIEKKQLTVKKISDRLTHEKNELWFYSLDDDVLSDLRKKGGVKKVKDAKSLVTTLKKEGRKDYEAFDFSKINETLDALRDLLNGASETNGEKLPPVDYLKGKIETIYDLHCKIKTALEQKIYGRVPVDVKILDMAGDQIVRKVYKDLVEGAFPKGIDLTYEIYDAYLDEEDGLFVSNNFNGIISKRSLKLIVPRIVEFVMDRLKLNKSKGEKDPMKYFVDMGPHRGGGRFYQITAHDGISKGEKCILIIPRLVKHTTEFLDSLVEKCYEAREVKTMKKGPYQGGATILHIGPDGFVGHEVITTDYLLLKAKHPDSKEHLVSLMADGDEHTGTPHGTKRTLEEDLQEMLSIEIAQVLGQYAIDSLYTERPIHLRIKTGDMWQGNHLPPIARVDETPTPYELRHIRGTNMRANYLAGTNDIEKQKDDAERFIGGPLKEYGRRGGSLALVSGNHTNKSSNFNEDEARTLERWFRDAYLQSGGELYVIPGGETGAGTIEFGSLPGNSQKLIIELHHRAVKRTKDPLFDFIEYCRNNPPCDIAIQGDSHWGQCGVANNELYVITPPIQAETTYGRSLSGELNPRGGVRIDTFTLEAENRTARRHVVYFMTGNYLERLQIKQLLEGKTLFWEERMGIPKYREFIEKKIAERGTD